MAIFHSYVRLPEAINFHILWLDGSKRLDSLQLSTVGMLRPSISLEFNVNCNGNHPNFALFQDSKLHTYIYIYITICPDSWGLLQPLFYRCITICQALLELVEHSHSQQLVDTKPSLVESVTLCRWQEMTTCNLFFLGVKEDN